MFFEHGGDSRARQPIPGFIDLPHVFRLAAGAEFALGDAAAVGPERVLHLRNGALDVLGSAVGQQMLAVDLAPEGDPYLERREVFHADAEDLGVQCPAAG